MLDFFKISTRSAKRGVIEVYPKFIAKKSSDLMIRGGDFYAIWIDELNLWSTDDDDALRLIDRELDKYAEEHKNEYDSVLKVCHLRDVENGMIDRWRKYCQKQMTDNFHMLDEKIIFSNTETTKEDYASKKLSYPMEAGDISAYDKLMSTLYSEDERKKIEWAIGAIISGDAKEIQKFMVLYGAAGTGKSTVLNIIQKLFEGYYSVFDAKSLGSSNSTFALEAFKSNPLVAIQHDGDLSRIEDNTRLNSLVSHELMTVNEKFKSTYANRFKCFLFMGTNKPVKITDAKSGLIRRLIDVSPSGNKLGFHEYNRLVKRVDFELGAIAKHCYDVYESDKDAYENYIPFAMLDASNDFYNFMVDSYPVFKKDDGVPLKAAWEMYKSYCSEARVNYPYSQRIFKEELKNYFEDYNERYYLDDGTRVRSYFSGFKTEKFMGDSDEKPKERPKTYCIEFTEQESLFDKEFGGYLAQYATDDKPSMKWDNVTTTLSDLDTSKVHYVKLPENHIVIDFDIPDENGEKSLERNLEAASKWPPTYAELSKSGKGIHLHYIYTGDATKLSRIFAEHIEVKVFTGLSSLRRKLTRCNNLPIAVLSSGLPLKKGGKVVNQKVIESEKHLRSLIKKNLAKEIHPATKPSVEFIFKLLEEAYASGMHYDVSDMKSAIIAFAAGSTHQSDICLKMVKDMKFKSEEPAEPVRGFDNRPIAFFDIEVFPNMVLICWKREDNDYVYSMFNPTVEEVTKLVEDYRLIGFNCRRYDNHILYALLIGMSPEQVYKVSYKIINNQPNAFFGEAYNLSYTDIYDFASAGNKMSLKKLEIEMDIHHQELGIPFDKPIPESLWDHVLEYCKNDVIATEMAFRYLKADWVARQILADLTGMTVNDTTNTLSTRFIFGTEKHPQDEFCYRDLSKPVFDLQPAVFESLCLACPDMMKQLHGDEQSLLPYFPGYEFKDGVSIYREETVGEGGYVYAEPGMYGNVALLDVASMHPHSVIAECLFGPRFTMAFREIVESRVDIKHESWDRLNDALGGKLRPYIEKVKNGEISSKDLAGALKTVINSVYGLTKAGFKNPFKDERNIDNIVAKRGALFMIDLKYEVQKRGFIVAHIKTDSIKIPDATPEIIQFVMDFGKKYGYTFEHEATYERFCLVNKAVYIARYPDGKWTATGDQFQVPYVFKTLFSKEPITFKDLCEVRSVNTSLYLDKNEGLPDVSAEEKQLKKYEHDYKKGIISDTTFEAVCPPLMAKIAEGHNYVFVGKVGQFCPIKPGCGGGLLKRYSDGKYYAAPDSGEYRWLESEVVRDLGKEDDIDISYYHRLVDEAISTLIAYGDYEWFVSDDPYISPEYVDGHPVYTNYYIGKPNNQK